ncbi:MAG: helix-turn-helix transcriptional regulator, partial [Clostridia bacterium]|nr:helix-turn-helix transcriptional regulator [Clostridia bacterium]
MYLKLTIQERLKDLRTEQKLTLEQLAEKTGISKSALGKYETEEYKDMSPFNLVTLANFYGVSTDYLLGLTEQKNHPNADINNLHLNDDMIDLLESGKINTRLLCEIATHEDFRRFQTDIEIYVDRIADMRINDLNAVLGVVRNAAMEKCSDENDLHVRTLELAQVDEDEYFSHVIHKDLDCIISTIRENQKLCDKKIVQKEKIEDRVVSVCRKLLTYENIEKISKSVAAACQADYDGSGVKRIKAAIRETEAAIENLWIALEKGQSVDMITERIEKRKTEKAELEAQLAIEMNKQVVYTEPQIRHYLISLRTGDLNDINIRRGFINIFVRAIYLYDDKMTIYLNSSDKETVIDDILIDETEEYFDSLNSALIGGSTVVASVPPHWRNPNLMPIGNGFGFFIVFENPWLCQGFRKSFSDAYTRKTPFDKIKVRLPTAPRNQKEDIQMNDN